jgi:hypothetical protein
LTRGPARSPAAAAATAAAVAAAIAALPGGPARAEDAPRLGAKVEVRVEAVEPDHRLEDARGVLVRFRYRVGRVDTEQALFLVATVNAGGRPVAALSTSAALRDRDGHLHGKKQLVTVPRGEWRRESFFVPYYSMKLAPGRHELTLDYEARSDTGSCKTGEPARRYGVLGDESTVVGVEKPPYRMVQLLAQRIDVEQVETDAAVVFRRGARPDLQWQVRFRAGAGGVVHDSETRDNAWSATWTRYTAPFPFSEGDVATVTVLDEDLLGDDVLGTFTLGLDDVLALGRGAPPRAAGKVKSLVFAPPKLR